MDDIQKVQQYQTAAKKLSSDDFCRIESYYTNWEMNEFPSLKHRFIKVFGINRLSGETRWIRLDRLLNRRRISNTRLGDAIRELMLKQFYPIRVFHVVSEWLDPRSVIHSNRSATMIYTGFVVFENDDDLGTSIKCAKQIDEVVQAQKTFVFSGNQSIHTWVHNFDPKTYLDVSEDEFMKKRELIDRRARYQYFKEIQSQTNFKLDKRVTIDSRRVIPVINSLNAFTFRKVLRLPSIDVTAEQVISLAKI